MFISKKVWFCFNAKYFTYDLMPYYDKLIFQYHKQYCYYINVFFNYDYYYIIKLNNLMNQWINIINNKYLIKINV